MVNNLFWNGFIQPALTQGQETSGEGGFFFFSLECHAEGSFLNSSDSIGLSLEILNIQWKREEVWRKKKSLKCPILFSNLLEWHLRISTMDKVAVQTQIDEEE